MRQKMLNWISNAKRLWQKVHRASPFASHMLLTAGTNIGLAVLGFLTGILAARLLGPQGRGELAVIQLWPSFIATLAMLGLPEALVYFSAREPERAGRWMGSAMALDLLSSGAFMMGGYFILPLLLSAQLDKVVEAARWYLLLIPLYALVGLPYHPLRGRQDFVRWNALRVLPTLGWLVVLLSAWGLGIHEPQRVAMAYLGVLALLFFPVMAVTIRRIPGPYMPEVSTWRPMIRYGIPAMASGLPQMLNFRLDQMVMTAFLPAKSLGLYVVAVGWSGILSTLLGALGSVLFPRISGEKDADRQSEILAQGGRLAVLGSLGIGVPLLIATPWALPFIFGAGFREAIPAALVLVLAGAVSGLNLVLEDGLRGLGRPTSVLWAELTGLIVTLPALAVLLPILGILGAAMASLLGYIAITAMLMVQVKRLTALSPMVILRPNVNDIRSGWKSAKVILEAIAR